MKRYSYLLRRYAYLLQRYSYLLQRYSYLLQLYSYLLQRYAYLLQRYAYLFCCHSAHSAFPQEGHGELGWWGARVGRLGGAVGVRGDEPED